MLLLWLSAPAHRPCQTAPAAPAPLCRRAGSPRTPRWGPSWVLLFKEEEPKPRCADQLVFVWGGAFAKLLPTQQPWTMQACAGRYCSREQLAPCTLHPSGYDCGPAVSVCSCAVQPSQANCCVHCCPKSCTQEEKVYRLGNKPLAPVLVPKPVTPPHTHSGSPHTQVSHHTA